MPPFSGKKKKEQLKARRVRRQAKNEEECAYEATLLAEHKHRPHTRGGGEDDTARTAHSMREAEYRYSADHTHAITSAFAKESAEEVNARRQANYLPLSRCSMMPETGIPFGSWFDTHMTHTHDDLGSLDTSALTYFPLSIEIATRGWSIETASCHGRPDDDADSSVTSRLSSGSTRIHDEDTARAAQEEARFARYVHTLEHNLHARSTTPWPLALVQLPCTLYERNIEVWRQLWRAVEYSDVVVFVTDARYPIVHLHLGLLSYIVRDQGKPCVIVLNKTDLVPRPTAAAWITFLKHYLCSLGLMTLHDNTDEENGHAVTTVDGMKKSVRATTDAVHANDDSACDVSHPNGGMYEGSVNTAATDVWRLDGRQVASSVAPIVLRTFTAQPQAETQTGAAETVSVDKRRRKRRQQRGKLYAQMRSGSMNPNAPHGNDAVASLLGYSEEDKSDDDDDDDNDCKERETVRASGTNAEASMWDYAQNEQFRGKVCAQNALHQDVQSHSKLKAVSHNIAELLTLCRSLAARRRSGISEACSQTCMRATSNNDNTQDTDTTNRCVNEVDSASPARIAFVGFPNVGKSTLLNCISGGKVVSVSATAGHTKHIQTIPLPHDGVVLVDSPGLALPLLGMPRPLQAVIGTHQIAQAHDPQSGVAFLATHLPLEKLYGLTTLLPREEENGGWSAYDFCEAYARKRGFYVKRGKGSLDTHRAAIALLQEAYEGRLVLFFAPPPLSFLDTPSYTMWVRPYSIVPVLESTNTVRNSVDHGNDSKTRHQ